jgi:pimeloyl-ACP methyl ester carboxylesterase
LFAVLLLLAAAACASPSGASLPPGATPVFKPTTCPFSLKGGKFTAGYVRCGYVLVPENRSVKHSPTIRLAVAVFKARGSHPAPDPLVYLIGGPGGYVVGPMGASIAQNGMPDYVGNRELILVDQRGTGLSQPALSCTEMYTARDKALTHHLTRAQTQTLYIGAVRSCRARLVKEGIDLGAYNTVESAADIADVRTALGYKSIDVYGGSYGSQLAQQLMRDHPQGIRSVVMDAVVVPPFKLVDEVPNLWHSLQVLFKNCAADQTICSILYPHLKQSLVKAVGRLQSHPPTFHIYFGDVNKTYEVKFDVAEFLRTLRWALMVPDDVPLVPKLITDTSKGDYGRAKQLESYFGSSNGVFTPYLGMALSMTCSANVARFTPARVTAAARVLPASLRAASAPVDQQLKACAIWKVPFMGGVNHAYFHSSIPSLLLPGAYDPNNLPALETSLAGHLTHSNVVYFPMLTHEVVGTGPCQDGIVREFLSDPSRRPDAGCIADMYLPWQ